MPSSRVRVVKYKPFAAAYREDNQYNHKCTLRDRTWLMLIVLGEEKQGAQAELLDIKPNEYMVQRFREEEAAGFAGGRLIVDPSEKVFVQEVKQGEGRKREAVDDGRYDGISERDYNQLSRSGEERAPFLGATRVLRLVHRARGGIKEDHFHIIHHQRPNLKEAAGCSRKTLKYNETTTSNKAAIKAPKLQHSRQEECGRFWKILSQK
jgi:hypothetical protein